MLDLFDEIYDIKGLERIRLGSLEPNLVTEKLVSYIKNHPKICNHFHLSLQSGCDSTLKRMNRKYSTAEYRDCVRLLRRHIDGAAITTDMMVGFPGEDDDEFKESYGFAKEIAFSKIHVFKYSPRKGTKAYEMKEQVNGKDKEKRSALLMGLSDKLQEKFQRQYVGKMVEVLWEGAENAEEGWLHGFTSNYIKVIAPGNLLRQGHMSRIRILDIKRECLVGEFKNG